MRRRAWHDDGPAKARTRTPATFWRPYYDWFTEGFDTPDLRDAKALLDGLT